MERRYEFSQASLPGKPVTNLFPNPNLSAQGGPSGGPYALCAKCHDLNQIMNNTSFSEHARHVKQDGFSCSACHTAHGMGAQSGTISGDSLVNFDANVVAPNGATPISSTARRTLVAWCAIITPINSGPLPALRNTRRKQKLEVRS
jgi:hypothetical protein